MVRKNIYITREQDDYLKSLSGHSSEHIRRAIDEYISKNEDLLKVSRSSSK